VLYLPSVAICIRLRDRRYSMLSRQPIVSARLKHIVIVSSSACQSHLKQMVESYHKLILSSRYRHRILGSVGCKGCLMITCSGNHRPEKRISQGPENNLTAWHISYYTELLPATYSQLLKHVKIWHLMFLE